MSDKIKKFPLSKDAKKRLALRNPNFQTKIVRSKKEKEKMLKEKNKKGNQKWKETTSKKKYLKRLIPLSGAFLSTLLYPKKAK